VKTPKGFGKKNYFTFLAILAYSVQNKLQSQVSTITSLFLDKSLNSDDMFDENDPPDELVELLTCTQTKKPCHCNCFYKRKTRLIVNIFKYIPRCPFYTTYFAFRRTGVHPPLILLIKNHNQNINN